VVFSDDWGEHPSSCQHIFRHIAKNHRVLWVNTIGMRNPTFTLTDFRKILIKVGKMLRLRREQSQRTETVGHLRVCQPIMLPFSGLGLVRKFNAWSVTRKVGAALRAMHLQDPIIVSTVPNAAEYPKILMRHRVVYYCVDDFSLWPGLDAKRVSDMERRLVEHSGIIIAVSDALAGKFSDSGKKVKILTHGVDLEHFAASTDSEHTMLKSIPAPRVGFFGLIDGRFDGSLVDALAVQMPDLSFIFAGPIDASAGVLPIRRNLHFVGPIPYAELPAFIAGMMVLILPYKTNGLADMLSPLKLKEYLATRKPVVSAPIAAVRDWSEFLSAPRSPIEWRAVLRTILDSKSVEQITKASERLAAESWSRKAEDLLALCRCVERSSPIEELNDSVTSP
jgi:glycosyltransferase involved in cell wall biosynthesis